MVKQERNPYAPVDWLPVPPSPGASTSEVQAGPSRTGKRPSSSSAIPTASPIKHEPHTSPQAPLPPSLPPGNADKKIPFLTELILALISASQRTTAKLTTLETQITSLEETRLKFEESASHDENVKAYNWCFEAAAIGCDDLREALNTLVRTQGGNPPRTEWERVLKKILDAQSMILNAIQKEGEIRTKEVEELRREIEKFRKRGVGPGEV